jgi:hypothetical protein
MVALTQRCFRETGPEPTEVFATEQNARGGRKHC